MPFCFTNVALERLYYEKIGAEDYPEGVVSAFFKRMQSIRHARDINDLRAVKGNHFEKMEDEDNTYSMRLNKKFRLIFGLNKEGGITVVAIRDISNHYD